MECELKCYDKDDHLLTEGMHYKIDGSIIIPINNSVIYKVVYNHPQKYKTKQTSTKNMGD